MALKYSHTDKHGNIYPEAYVRISSLMYWNNPIKKTAYASLTIYKDVNSDLVEEQHIDLDVEQSLDLNSVYTYLKTLEQFSCATDV